jgi:cephalosporin hydroxylase
LTKFNLKYQNTRSLNPQDDNNLYIIAGELKALNKSMMPKYYIIYQTSEFSTKNLPLLTDAIAIWDSNWSSINEYKNKAQQYYFLPDENYEFLDPVILPCFLPKNALHTYRELAVYSNAVNSDISSHVPSLFCHCMFQNPAVIIDSGVRGGDGSTIPLNAVSKALNADMIGLDIVNCNGIYSKLNNPNARFFAMSDLDFPVFFKRLKVKKNTADFVFIDTSHEYVHTLQEIKAFAPMLSENGALGFHDSNVTPLMNNSAYRRLNDTVTGGIKGNPRGVTQAIKEYFNIEFNEHKFFNDVVEKDGYLWNIVHYPFCNGLTITKKLKKID